MHFDNWILVLLVVIVSLLRWLASKASASKTSEKEEEPTSRPSPRTPQQTQPRRVPPLSDEEQIRKFLEALGQPRTAKPPTPVRPRTDVGPRPVAPVQPPPSRIPIPDIRRARRTFEPRTAVPPPVPAVKQAQAFPQSAAAKPKQPYEPAPLQQAEVPALEVYETVAPQPEVGAVVKSAAEAAGQFLAADRPQQTTVAALLGSSRSVRDAIILREILGKPRGLQSLEDLPGTA